MLIRHLGLMPRGFVDVETAGPAGPAVAQVRLYDARLTLGGHPIPLFPVEAAGIVPATSGVLVIVGRDVLAGCTLLFDGQNRAFTLWT
jgi:hypothetical protein